MRTFRAKTIYLKGVDALWRLLPRKVVHGDGFGAHTDMSFTTGQTAGLVF